MTLIPSQFSPAKEYTITREDFAARWRTRQSEWARIAHWSMERESANVLQDFEAVTQADHDAEFSGGAGATAQARMLMDVCRTSAYRLAHRMSDPQRHVRAELRRSGPGVSVISTAGRRLSGLSSAGWR
jgi:hypothetical protein